MMIKDLELAQDLSREEQAAVRGGVTQAELASILNGGATQSAPGFSLVNTQVQLNMPINTITQVGIGLDTNVNTLVEFDSKNLVNIGGFAALA